jgi:hypothetical protein
MGTTTSLSGSASVGPGIEKHLAKTTARFTMIVTLTGNPISCSVVLQGSHDGVAWVDIGNVQTTTGGVITTGSDSALVSYVRADLRSLVGSASVTATIASDDGT